MTEQSKAFQIEQGKEAVRTLAAQVERDNAQRQQAFLAKHGQSKNWLALQADPVYQVVKLEYDEACQQRNLLAQEWLGNLAGQLAIAYGIPVGDSGNIDTPAKLAHYLKGNPWFVDPTNPGLIPDDYRDSFLRAYRNGCAYADSLIAADPGLSPRPLETGDLDRDLNNLRGWAQAVTAGGEGGGAGGKRKPRRGRMAKNESEARRAAMLAKLRQHPTMKDDVPALAREAGVDDRTVRRWLDEDERTYRKSLAAMPEKNE